MKKFNKDVILLISLVIKIVSSGECDEPRVVNGQVTGDKIDGSFFGQVECKPGFHLVGLNKNIKCREGQWSPVNLPLCVEIGSCPELPELLNGRNIPIRGSYGSAYQFKCNKGFRRFGEGRTGCHGHSWSHNQFPICTAVGCEEMGMLDIPYGRGKRLMFGSVFRYRCNSGAVMKGPELLYCDGKHWNGTAPDCYVPPSPPFLQLSVGGAQPETIKKGSRVLVKCQSTGGNPVPDIGFTMNGRPIPEVSKDFRSFQNTFTFTASSENNLESIECTASNSVGEEVVERLLYVDEAPFGIKISGPNHMEQGDQAEYECRADGGSPQPKIKWFYKNEIIEEGNFLKFTPSTEVSKAEIMCSAENYLGKSSRGKRIDIHYLPKRVHIDGPSEATVGEKISLMCRSGPGNPVPTLRWRIETETELLEIMDKEAETSIVENSESGVSVEARTELTIKSTDRKVSVSCIASVEGLNKFISSEVLNVAVKQLFSPPMIGGLGDGSSLVEGEEINISCTSPVMREVKSFIWLINGDVFKEDALVEENEYGEFVSILNYRPSVDDQELGCKVNTLKNNGVRVGIKVRRRVTTIPPTPKTTPILVTLSDQISEESMRDPDKSGPEDIDYVHNTVDLINDNAYWIPFKEYDTEKSDSTIENVNYYSYEYDNHGKEDIEIIKKAEDMEDISVMKQIHIQNNEAESKSLDLVSSSERHIVKSALNLVIPILCIFMNLEKLF